MLTRSLPRRHGGTLLHAAAKEGAVHALEAARIGLGGCQWSAMPGDRKLEAGTIETTGEAVAITETVGAGEREISRPSI